MNSLSPESMLQGGMGRNQWAIIVAMSIAAASGCEAGQSAVDATTAISEPAASTLLVAAKSCVGRWQAPVAGPHSFELENRGAQPLQVTLINASTGAIFGEVGQLDPGTSRPLDVDAPAGPYRFRCVPRRGVASVSAVERIRGSGGSSATALNPLSAEEIVTAVSVYRHGVVRGVAALVHRTDRLLRAVRRRDLVTARRDWLTAHMSFASLGAAYGTFGDLADKIDGRPDGLPLGVKDPTFTGFLAIERLLWNGGPHAQLLASTSTLDRFVHVLQTRLPHLTLIAGDLPLRAHEILENALQFELTGDTDEGSHTNLATVLANVHGTQLVIRALTPAIQQRRPALLASMSSQLLAFANDLRETRENGGGWPSISSLPVEIRERLDAQVDGLLEELALLPGILTLPPSLALP